MILPRTSDPRPESLDALGLMLARLVPARGRVVALACCHPVAGRGALAARCARELVLAGQRTLLVDADHMEPELHEHFGVPAAPGLAQVVRDPQALAATREVEQGLWLLPAGIDRVEPETLAGTEETAGVLQAAAVRFGAVIVVTPPLLSDASGAVACRGADIAVLVLPKGVTRKEEAARAARYVRGSGATLGGAVIVP